MPKAVSIDYQSKVHKPDDFDAFWDDVLRQAATIPLQAEVVPDPLRTSQGVEVTGRGSLLGVLQQPRARAHRCLVLPSGP